MKMKVKAKGKFPHAGKIHKVIHTIDHTNGGVAVHVVRHPSNEHEYPQEEPAGTYGTEEEGLAQHAKLRGIDATIEPPVGETDVAKNAGDAEEAAKVA